MKIIPPAAEKDRYLLKTRMECALRRMQGGDWRVDIIAGRYGWYARAVPLRRRRKGRGPRGRTGSGADIAVRVNHLAGECSL